LTHPIVLSPSLLSANFGSFADAAGELVAAGAESLHFDIMDGHFVPNLTFGPQLVRDLRPITSAFQDVHIMVEHPDTYIDELSASGASMVTVHAEAAVHLDRVVHQINDAGMKSGVALNPATPIGRAEWVLDVVDRVLVMTVNPGFGGQQFIRSMLAKIEQLDQIRTKRNLSFEIAVDGGVSAQTAADVVRAGATALIAGSAVFKHPAGLKAAIAELRSAAESGLTDAAGL
jgi:ribulose-phosphate 3-epimerase